MRIFSWQRKSAPGPDRFLSSRFMSSPEPVSNQGCAGGKSVTLPERPVLTLIEVAFPRYSDRRKIRSPPIGFIVLIFVILIVCLAVALDQSSCYDATSNSTTSIVTAVRNRGNPPKGITRLSPLQQNNPLWDRQHPYNIVRIHEWHES